MPIEQQLHREYEKLYQYDYNPVSFETWKKYKKGLKECPFCGGKAKLWVNNKSGIRAGEVGNCHVSCVQCMRTTVSEHFECTEEDIKKSVSSWNARTPPADGDRAAVLEKNIRGIEQFERVVCIDSPEMQGTVIHCGDDGVIVRWDDGKTGELIWDSRVAYNAYRLQTIRADLTAPVQGDGWLPIETAPKDGTEFLCWCSQKGCQNNKTRYVITKIENDMYDGLMFFDDPLKWQPLPNPPKGEDNDR